MTSLSAIHEAWLKATEAITHAGAPGAAWTLLIPLVATGILRLLAEWQNRHTITRIFQHAPDGSIIVISKRGLGGTMWIQVGTRPAPAQHSWPELT